MSVWSTTSKHTLFELWHHRLGHSSVSRMKFLNKKVPGIVEYDFSCIICSLAKQKKLPFPNNHLFSEKTFDLIHCDVWGPLSTLTIECHIYFLIVVNDFTRVTWVYILSWKSLFSVIYPQFFKLVKRQFNAKTKTICTDYDTKFYPIFLLL